MAFLHVLAMCNSQHHVATWYSYMSLPCATHNTMWLHGISTCNSQHHVATWYSYICPCHVQLTTPCGYMVFLHVLAMCNSQRHVATWYSYMSLPCAAHNTMWLHGIPTCPCHVQLTTPCNYMVFLHVLAMCNSQRHVTTWHSYMSLPCATHNAMWLHGIPTCPSCHVQLNTCDYMVSYLFDQCVLCAHGPQVSKPAALLI